MRKIRRRIPFMVWFAVSCVSFSISSTGCAAIQQAQMIDTSATTFVEHWRRGDFAAMYGELHPALQHKVPFDRFVASQQQITEVVGQLISYKKEPVIPGWSPPLLDETLFQRPLASEENRIVYRFHLYFKQSEGHALITLKRDGFQAKVISFNFGFSEPYQSVLVEKLNALGIERPEVSEGQ